jgi:hypothetical protein
MLTPDKLKAWARENRALAMTVCKATAFAQLERERVDAYVEPIFDRYGFTDEDGDPITSPERLYNCEDEQACSVYYAECLRAHAEHGWKGDPEHCPALVAEDLQIKAENLLLGSLAEFLGLGNTMFTFSSRHGNPLETRKAVLELALGACIGGVK